jgi:hypothetical protein
VLDLQLHQRSLSELLQRLLTSRRPMLPHNLISCGCPYPNSRSEHRRFEFEFHRVRHHHHRNHHHTTRKNPNHLGSHKSARADRSEDDDHHHGERRDDNTGLGEWKGGDYSEEYDEYRGFHWECWVDGDGFRVGEHHDDFGWEQFFELSCKHCYDFQQPRFHYHHYYFQPRFQCIWPEWTDYWRDENYFGVALRAASLRLKWPSRRDNSNYCRWPITIRPTSLRRKRSSRRDNQNCRWPITIRPACFRSRRPSRRNHQKCRNSITIRPTSLRRK